MQFIIGIFFPDLKFLLSVCLKYIIDINISSSWSSSPWRVNIYYIYINISYRRWWWYWWLSPASSFLSVGVVIVSLATENEWFRFLQFINTLLFIWSRPLFCIASIIFLPSLYCINTLLEITMVCPDKRPNI